MKITLLFLLLSISLFGSTDWNSLINVKDNGNGAQSLSFGLSPIATDGIDVALGETVLPPLPPSGIFDLRFQLPITPPDFSQIDFRNDTIKTAIWKMLFQPGSGGYPFTFTWDNASLPAGTFYLKDLVTDGNVVNVNMKTSGSYTLTLSGINSLKIEYTKPVLGIKPETMPAFYTVYQNYPNPFNPSTTIRFDIPEQTKVNLSIYNLLGELVETLLNGQLEAGYHQAVWDAEDMASGIYFYRLTTDKFSSIKKLMLIK